MTNEISRNKYHYWELNHQHQVLIIELVEELLENTFIFYYDAQLGVNVITFKPLLAGNK